MKNIVYCFSISIFMLNTIYLNGQCKVSEIASSGRLFANGGRIGQTFTACEDGLISKIEIYLTTLGEHYLWLGTPNGGLLDDLQLTFEVTERGVQELILTEGFLVEKSESYELQIQVNPAKAIGNLTGYQETNFGPDYLGGFFTSNGRRGPSRDLNFSVHVEENIIPTLSQWSLILYVLLILNLSCWLLSERKIGEVDKTIK